MIARPDAAAAAAAASLGESPYSFASFTALSSRVNSSPSYVTYWQFGYCRAECRAVVELSLREIGQSREIHPVGLLSSAFFFFLVLRLSAYLSVLSSLPLYRSGFESRSCPRSVLDREGTRRPPRGVGKGMRKGRRREKCARATRARFFSARRVAPGRCSSRRSPTTRGSRQGVLFHETRMLSPARRGATAVRLRHGYQWPPRAP